LVGVEKKWCKLFGFRGFAGSLKCQQFFFEAGRLIKLRLDKCGHQKIDNKQKNQNPNKKERAISLTFGEGEIFPDILTNC